MSARTDAADDAATAATTLARWRAVAVLAVLDFAATLVFLVALDLVAPFLEAPLLATAFVPDVFLAVAFLAAALLVAVFFAVAFLAVAFLAVAFALAPCLAAAFLGAALAAVPETDVLARAALQAADFALALQGSPALAASAASGTSPDSANVSGTNAAAKTRFQRKTIALPGKMAKEGAA